MIFTKWRYKSGHTPPDDPALIMQDMADGSMEQVTFESCPYKADVDNDNTPCWCSAETRDACSREI